MGVLQERSRVCSKKNVLRPISPPSAREPAYNGRKGGAGHAEFWGACARSARENAAGQPVGIRRHAAAACRCHADPDSQAAVCAAARPGHAGRAGNHAGACALPAGAALFPGARHLAARRKTRMERTCKFIPRDRFRRTIAASCAILSVQLIQCERTSYPGRHAPSIPQPCPRPNTGRGNFFQSSFVVLKKAAGASVAQAATQAALGALDGAADGRFADAELPRQLRHGLFVHIVPEHGAPLLFRQLVFNHAVHARQLLLPRQARTLIALIPDSLHCGHIPFHNNVRSVPPARSSAGASAPALPSAAPARTAPARPASFFSAGAARKSGRAEAARCVHTAPKAPAASCAPLRQHRRALAAEKIRLRVLAQTLRADIAVVHLIVQLPQINFPAAAAADGIGALLLRVGLRLPGVCHGLFPPTGSCRFRQDIPFISNNSILQDSVAVKQNFTYFGIF